MPEFIAASQPEQPGLEFRPRRAFFVVYALGMLLLGTMGGLIGYAVFFSGHPNARPHGPAQWLGFSFLVGTLIALSLAGLVALILRFPYRIRLYHDALEIRKSWRNVQTVAFAEIATVRSSRVFVAVNGVPLGTISHFRMKTTDGRELKLSGTGYGCDITPLIDRIAA